MVWSVTERLATLSVSAWSDCRRESMVLLSRALSVLSRSRSSVTAVNVFCWSWSREVAVSKSVRNRSRSLRIRVRSVVC